MSLHPCREPARRRVLPTAAVMAALVTTAGCSAASAPAAGPAPHDPAAHQGPASSGPAVSAPVTTATGVVRAEEIRGVLQPPGAGGFDPGTETVVQRLVFPPGVSSGWHLHPGDVVFIVTAGALTSYGLDAQGCAATTIRAGQSYVARLHAHHPHMARNEGVVPAEVTAVGLNIPPGAKIARPAAPPSDCSGH